MKLQYVSKLGAKLHAPKTPDSAGYDIETPIDINLYPGEFMIVDTGIVVQLPKVEGKRFHLKIYPRSSTKFVLINSVGVIDSDYCGINDTLKLRIYRPDMEDAKDRIKIVGYEFDGDEFKENYDGLLYVRRRNMCKMHAVYIKQRRYTDPLLYKAGDRFAQLVIEAHEVFDLEAVAAEDYQSPKDRGGFGSTGTR